MKIINQTSPIVRSITEDFDFFLYMPNEMTFHILSFLNPNDLGTALGVSTLFRTIINSADEKESYLKSYREEIKATKTRILDMIAQDYKKGWLTVGQSPEEQKEGSFTITFLETMRQDPKRDIKLNLFLLSDKTNKAFYHCFEEYATYAIDFEISMQGHSQDVQEYQNKALEMRKKLFPTEPDPDLAFSLANIANRLSARGRFQHALGYAKQALAMREKLFHEEPHPDLADSLQYMAIISSHLEGHLQNALDYSQKALAMRKKLFQEPHQDLLASLLQVLDITFRLFNPCDFEKVLEYSEEAFTMLEKLFPEVLSPDFAKPFEQRATILVHLGRYPEALQDAEKAFAIRKKFFQEDAPNIELANSRMLMSDILSLQGIFPQALDYAKEALAMQQAFFQEMPDPGLADLFTSVGVCLYNLGSNYFEEALDYEEQALSMREELFQDKPHVSLLISLEKIEFYLSKLEGRSDDALDYAKEAVAMKEKLFEEGFYPCLVEWFELANSLGDMGVRLYERGDFEEALLYEARALSIREKIMHHFKSSSKHERRDPTEEYDSRLANSYNNMAIYLSILNRPYESLEYAEQALKMRENLFSKPHPDTAYALRNVAISLENLGQYEEARKHYQAALIMMKKLFSDTDNPQLVEVEQDIERIQAGKQLFS